MLLGISSYTYTWSVGVQGFEHRRMLDSIELIKKASEYRIGLLQICDNIKLESYSKEQLVSIKAFADFKNIVLEVGTRGTEINHMLKFLDICKILGAKTLRTIIHSPSQPVTIKEAENNFKSVIKRFEEENIVIVIENHDKHKVDELISIIEGVKSESLKICLDTVNSFGALESPDYVIDKLSPYVGNIHLKDFTIERVGHQMGFSIVGTAAGQGMLDCSKVIELAVEKDVNIVLELWTPYTNSIEETIEKEENWAHQSIEYIKQAICSYE
ncbi:MAG TPA: TIM barrel protein [Clostridia bacterium]|nr:TIM barrel protein [Clostridia bacterium]